MKKFLTVLSIALLVSGTVLASFPVQKSNQAEQTEVQTTVSDAPTDANSFVIKKSEAQKALKNEMSKESSNKMDDKLALILLWVFLGGFAAHRWYAGKPVGWNILFILTAGGCGIWAIIDLINILRDDFM